LGYGISGPAIKARSKKSGSIITLKYLPEIFGSFYATKKAVREIKILKALSEIETNVFTPKLLDIIVPVSGSDGPGDLEKVDGLFLVFEFVQTDLKKVLDKSSKIKFST